jgi:hypothetical protein
MQFTGELAMTIMDGGGGFDGNVMLYGIVLY